MQFNFVTLFPEKIESYFATGLPGKAIQNGVFGIKGVQLRDFAGNKHNKVDDTIYGGGPGMLLQIEPIHKALLSLGEDKGIVILMSPSGKPFTQALAKELADKKVNLTFISGYYEGVDHRVTQHLVDIEVSLGNYVLSSGDLASLCVADAVGRLIPGFMGEENSLSDESHNLDNVLEYPQYTKPYEYGDWKVPEILVSGNHAEIRKWREKNRKRTD